MKEFVISFCVFLCVVLCIAETADYKVCVSHNDTESCTQMDRALASTNYKISCAYGRDKVDCMRMVKNGEADFINLAANEAYVAFLNYTLLPIIQEEFDGKTHGIMYEAIAVVRRSSQIASLKDLKNKKSCHTGFARNAGWSIPISILRAAPGVMGPECDELQAVSKFFSQSCVPGNWTSDTNLDPLLKSSNKNLCELCKSKCEGPEVDYIGYTGALRCLTETNADVAFTKLTVLDDFFRSLPSKGDFALLCSNGSNVAIDSPNPCYWAARPNNVIVTRPGQEIQEIRSAILQTFSLYSVQKPSWLERTLVSNNSVSALSTEQDAIMDLLDKYNFRITIDKPLPSECREKYARFCVTSQLEHDKCHDLKVAAFAQRLRPNVECHMENSTVDCLAAIRDGKADIITVDSGDVLLGSKSYDLKPILSEVYGENSLSYYAVAVVKRDSNITSLETLRGKKSCHTGFGRTAGWNVPIGTLKRKGLIEGEGCAIQMSVAKFFGASCAPGVVGQDSLCELCAGNDQGQKKCEASADERYFGYTGAFRCLVEGGGDVAFVKHTTVPENTDGHSNADWAIRLLSADYELLCLDGTKRHIGDYESCNWARVASHQVLAKITDKNTLDLQLMLTKAATSFAPSKELFQLFGKYNNTKDLLFKDSASGLRGVVDGTSVRDVLGKELYDDLEATFCARPVSGAPSITRMAVTSVLAFCFGLLFLGQRLWWTALY